ncbi:hypothetical protein [Treponema pedis]|uniref:hypothetical protein n=1 Tax=Treponema pedis TaxID=409322 RepID=UPI003D20E3FE
MDKDKREYFVYVRGKTVLVSEEIHQNYLKRKANGKQKEYEERYKTRRERKKQEKLKVLKRAWIPVCEVQSLLTE